MHTIYNWLVEFFKAPDRRDIEAYLNESVSHYDLEQRIKTLSRRGML